MNAAIILIAIAGLAAIGWLAGRARAASFEREAKPGRRPHSLPFYHGWFVALWTAVPALLFLAIWSWASPAIVTDAVLASPAAQGLTTDPA